MNARITLCTVLAFALGVLARDLFTTRASAGEDALRREDVTAFVRLQESQLRAMQEQTRALEAQAKATQEVAREVRDAGRSCK